MFDPELESFKTSIDLRAYAATQGYTVDRKESWAGSAVMRNSGGDKIIIKLDAADGHYVYFSVRDDKDNGTIIDFVKHRGRLNLGAIRKELRGWVGQPAVPLPLFPPLSKTGKDRMQVEAVFAKMREVRRHPYLEGERRIPGALLQAARFAGCIRMDARGNAVFPHFDEQGLCGYEIKNHRFTGFASGGTKGLWSSQSEAEDGCLVFCESAIDALSYAVLFPDNHTRYASISGKPNPVQPGLIRASAARMPAGSEVIAAMDADADGAKLAELVRDAVALAGRDDLRFGIEEPLNCKDWNDQLRAMRKPSLPAVLGSFPALDA